MRREGRQHGMVRTHMVLPSPKSRLLNKLDSAPTAGVYTKVPSKPTNHSKFTGRCCKPKCMACHLRPAGKSRDKVKGARRRSGANVMTDSSGGCLCLNGPSATTILGRFSGEHYRLDWGEEDGVSDDEASYSLVGGEWRGRSVEGDEMAFECDDEDWFLVGKI